MNAKRLIDIVGAAAGLAVTAPVIGATALVVRATLGKPVLFRQTRPGLGGRPFTIYKFRTMHVGTGSDEARMSRVGAFLRRTSLDELPQLWNVLKGDMSLVGPRPLLMEYLPLYNARQALRHNVRPGVTSLSAATKRNTATWAEQLESDAWYAEHQSLWLDFQIMARTALTVVRRTGISQEGHVTRERFSGAA